MVTATKSKAPLEIERKFLLRRLPPNLHHFHSRTIEQGYLAVKTDGTQIRLRKAVRRHSLTVKRGRGLSRQEIEIDLTRDQAIKKLADLDGDTHDAPRKLVEAQEAVEQINVLGAYITRTRRVQVKEKKPIRDPKNRGGIPR